MSESGDSNGASASGGGLFSRLARRWRAGEEGDDRPAQAGAEEGRSASESRRDMIARVVAFDSKRVDDVMAPRADIVAVEADTDLQGLIRAFAEAGHSRLPIYRGDLDDPVGMVHIKDVVALLADGEGEETPPPAVPVLERIRREVLYVPASMQVTDLLVKMQASRIHMALVIDEYGGTDGLVTIEDLVEQIVGEINDEHDDDEAPALLPRGGGWEADARVELGDFREATGVDLDLEDDEVDTLGGLAVALAGRVPQRGEVLPHPAGFEIEIAAADPRKVRRLTIRREPAAARPGVAGPSAADASRPRREGPTDATQGEAPRADVRPGDAPLSDRPTSDAPTSGAASGDATRAAE